MKKVIIALIICLALLAVVKNPSNDFDISYEQMQISQ